MIDKSFLEAMARSTAVEVAAAVKAVVAPLEQRLSALEQKNDRLEILLQQSMSKSEDASQITPSTE